MDQFEERRPATDGISGSVSEQSRALLIEIVDLHRVRVGDNHSYAKIVDQFLVYHFFQFKLAIIRSAQRGSRAAICLWCGAPDPVCEINRTLQKAWATSPPSTTPAVLSRPHQPDLACGSDAVDDNKNSDRMRASLLSSVAIRPTGRPPQSIG
jgi:hypothetical protein